MWKTLATAAVLLALVAALHQMPWTALLLLWGYSAAWRKAELEAIDEAILED